MSGSEEEEGRNSGEQDSFIVDSDLDDPDDVIDISSDSESEDPDDFNLSDLYDDSFENFDEDDHSMNEYSLPSSQEEDMENEIEDGGYDDDTDADDEIVVLDPGGENHGRNESDDQDTDVEDDDNNDGADADVVGSPPRKVARMEPIIDTAAQQGTSTTPTQQDEEKESETCSICTEVFTNSGEHRISCLRCGHVFGKSCIEKWLMKSKRCPQCNCKSKKGEIRVLYVKSLQAIDNTELTEAKKELEKAQITISKYTLDTAKQKITIESLRQQLRSLEQQNINFKMKQNNMMNNNNNNNNPGGSNFGSSSLSLPTSQNNTIVPTSPSCTIVSPPTGRKQLRYSFAKLCDIKEGLCRVGAYNQMQDLMVVSHDMKNSLFPNGCCGIKQINMLELRPTLSMPLHQKQIRDMQFSLCQSDVILTVAMDKKAMLYNCGGNVTVQTFITDYPLWSCVWDEDQQHIFYVGCSNGTIIAYDIRSPQDPLATYPQRQDKTPVCRLRYVSRSYQSRAFNLNGLLVQHLNSVHFGEYRGGNNSEIRFHQLPVEGTFVNVGFEKLSGHMLVSTRPSQRDGVNHGSHLLCDLSQYYSETLERNVVTSNVVRVYEGSTHTPICRPSIYSPEEGYVYVLANGAQNTVKYWDISLPEANQKSISNAPEYVLDYVHGRVNSNYFVGLISEKGVRIFNQTFDF